MRQNSYAIVLMLFTLLRHCLLLYLYKKINICWRLLEAGLILPLNLWLWEMCCWETDAGSSKLLTYVTKVMLVLFQTCLLSALFSCLRPGIKSQCIILKNVYQEERWRLWWELWMKLHTGSLAYEEAVKNCYVLGFYC